MILERSVPIAVSQTMVERAEGSASAEPGKKHQVRHLVIQAFVSSKKVIENASP